MKKLISILLCALLLVGFGSLTVMANTPISVTLNSNPIAFDVPPQMVDSRTMVPLRAIFEALNADIDWDGDTQTITATRESVVVVMQVDNPVITVSGASITLDVPPLIINSRTLVPTRAVAESFGVDVQWNQNTQTVVLTTELVQGPTPVEPPAIDESLPYAGHTLVGRWVRGGGATGGLSLLWEFSADGTGRRANGITDMDDRGIYENFNWTIVYYVSDIGVQVRLVRITPAVGPVEVYSLGLNLRNRNTMTFNNWRTYSNMTGGTTAVGFGRLLTETDEPTVQQPTQPTVNLDSALFGTWAAFSGISAQEFRDLVAFLGQSDDDLYLIRFHNNGQGWRGLAALGQDFSWNVVSEGRVVLSMMGGQIPLTWTYRINGDVLTMESVATPEVTFTFVRW